MDFFKDLNPQQRAAVEAPDGPLVIIAGPGTGKTKTLAARIAYLISTGRAAPHEILALTFTTKAALEMRDRVTGLLGPAAQTLPRVTTFHALCFELLRARNGEPLTVVNELQRLSVIRELARPAGLKNRTVRELSTMLSMAKSTTQSPDDPALAGLLAEYNHELERRELCDFDDLLLEAYRRLSQDDSWRAKVQSATRYLFIDEFQDTNPLQYELARLLIAHENLFVIGDPRQSIYAFRGASRAVFARFQADFPASTCVVLDMNYRSTPEVVQLANVIFPDETPLKAVTENRGQVQAVLVLHEYSEAAWVIGQIEQQIGGSDFLRSHAMRENAGVQSARRFGDFAVLYRTHHTAKVVQRAFADSGLPYQVVGEGTPYERPQIAATVQLLRTLVHGEPLDRSVKPLAQLSHLQSEALLEPLRAQGEAPLSELIGAIITTFGLEPADDAAQGQLNQFMGTALQFEERGPAALLEHIDLISEHGFYDPAADAVTLLTIHAAKGLEFAHVFLIAAEEGLLPHIRRAGKGATPDFDEERRLFYVAATRAKDRLDIMHARARAGRPAALSRFVAELPEGVIARTSDASLNDQLRKRERRQHMQRQATLF